MSKRNETKKRIELQIDLRTDKDIVEYLDKYVDNNAGFIKHLLREYVRFNNKQTNKNIYSNNNNTDNSEQEENAKKTKDTIPAFLSTNVIVSEDD